MIEILSKVVHTVTKKEEEDKEIVKPEPNYEGLWIVTPFEENDYWFLKTGIFILFFSFSFFFFLLFC